MTRHTGQASVSELFATEVDLPAPAEEVFRHLTDPAAMVRWMGQHATLRPVPGGAFEIEGVPVRGQYLEIDPPRRVLVSWGVAGNPGLPPGATHTPAGRPMTISVTTSTVMAPSRLVSGLPAAGLVLVRG